MHINCSAAADGRIVAGEDVQTFRVDACMRAYRSAQLFGLSLAIVLICVLTLTAITY